MGFGEIGGARRQILQDLFQQQVQVVPLQGGNGDNFGKLELFGIEIHEGKQPGLGEQVDLVEQEQCRQAALPDQFQNKAVTGTISGGDVHHGQQQIDALQGIVDGPHHSPVQLIPGLVNSRSIGKDDLSFRLGVNAQNFVPGCLGLVRDDGHLLPQQVVEQGGFSGIGTADQGDESRLEAGAPRLREGLPGRRHWNRAVFPGRHGRRHH